MDEPQLPPDSASDDREIADATPYERLLLVGGFTTVGLVVGLLVYPESWGLGLQLLAGALTGITAVLCVYVNRFLGE